MFRGSSLLKSRDRKELDGCVNNALFTGEPAMPDHQLTPEEREVMSQLHYSGTGQIKDLVRQRLLGD